MKRILIIISILFSVYCVNASDLIAELGEVKIYKKDIPSDDKAVIIYAKQVCNINIDEKDKAKIEELRKTVETSFLNLRIREMADKQLREKYFDRVVSEQDIANNKSTYANADRIRADANEALIKAWEYMDTSNEDDKVNIAYEKFLKGESTLTHWQHNNANPAYRKFVYKEVENAKKGIDPIQKRILFAQKIPEFILKDAAEKDPAVKKYLSERKTKPDVKYELEINSKWMAEELKKLGLKLYTDEYGSLEDILNLYPQTIVAATREQQVMDKGKH